MFERFAQSARDVVAGAQDEARGLGHGYIGCEHLLIATAATHGAARAALLATGATPESLRAAAGDVVGRGGPDADALATLGIDLAEVRRRVESAFGPGALERPRGKRCGDRMPFTPRSKQALERSLRAAVAHGDREIRPEHILLGILDTPGNAGTKVLERLGVTPDRVRSELGGSA
jgi:ATP-dependent Clp protease ATP-binding subunit ClpA